MEMMTDYLQVTTTIDSQEQAQKLARQLVERRLAACVQVLGPATSTYFWQGRVEEAGEWVCVAKTTQLKYPALEDAILKLHPYEVPEVLTTPIVAGNKAYLDWIDQELGVGAEMDTGD
jgi:periplasmic divalent cation tolerance protein